jgi:hypothetical protein
VEAQIDGNPVYAIRLVDESTEHNPALFQSLPGSDVQSISGAQVTIGAWIWADKTIETYLPRIMFINAKGQRWLDTPLVTVSPQPTFYAYKIHLPVDISRVFIVIKPFNNNEQTGNIYVANPVLVEGVYDRQTTPQFTNASAGQGNWAGKPFINLIRNAGTIQAWPKFRDYVFKIANIIDYRLAEGSGV